MADFGFVKDQAVQSEATAEITLYNITMPNGTHPVLVGRYAGESNAPYYNALLKKQARRVSKQQAAVRAGAITPEMIIQNREDDRELFAKFVIVGWRNICDAKKKPVTFGAADCQKFLEALPSEDFDEAREYFGNRAHFREDGDDTITTEEAVVEGNA